MAPMELLRRALLVGSCLAGLWLLRLAPLDPLFSIRPVDLARQQQEEARRIPDDLKTVAERRRAELPLSVYIEELLQFNVFPAAGPEWDRFLRGIDAKGATTGSGRVFLRANEPLISEVAGKLASNGGLTYISMSRSGGDIHYELAEHRWTRDAFAPGRGFVGTPVPPDGLLYPFRALGTVLALGGLAMFFLLPVRSPACRVNPRDLTALGAGLCLFALPLVATGGSAQSLTRGLLLTLPCWTLAAAAFHLFAAPWRTAPTPLARGAGGDNRNVHTALFIREGLVFLLMALGPIGFLIWGTVLLWNR